MCVIRRTTKIVLIVRHVQNKILSWNWLHRHLLFHQRQIFYFTNTSLDAYEIFQRTKGFQVCVLKVVTTQYRVLIIPKFKRDNSHNHNINTRNYGLGSLVSKEQL